MTDSNIETHEPEFVIDSRKRYESAKEALFGVDLSNNPVTRTDRPEEVRASLREVLTTGLSYIKAQKETAFAGQKVSLEQAVRSKGLGPGPLGYEKQIADYETAIDGVDCKRANADTLLRVVSEIAADERKDAESQRRIDLDQIPVTDRKFIFFGGSPDATQVAQVENRYQAVTKQIDDVVNIVPDYATNWTQEAQGKR